MRKFIPILIPLLLLFVVFTRFWNIEYTPRFTRDESSDLARMHSYWKAKKITLVGPISSDNIKVFSSLTYYMQMPFAAAWDFEPVGPAIGTAFWGVLTIVLLMLIERQLRGPANRNLLSYLYLLVVAIWTPLLLTSRWAWNPHLVAFWIALGVAVYFTKWRFRHLLTGLFLGMSIHHHYIAIFAVGTFGLIESLLLFKKKEYLKIAQLFVGFLIAVSPFILFDLRHPPGLFIGSYLRGNSSNIEGVTLLTLLPKLARNSLVAINEIVLSVPLQISVLIGMLAVLWHDITKNRSNLLFFMPVVAQIVGPIVVDGYSQRYFLPALIFFVVWLILPRIGKINRAALLILASMLLSSLWKLPSVLMEPIASPPLTVVTQAERAIVDIYSRNGEIKNANVATLTGSDLDALAEKYRDLLSIRSISFRAASEYDASENLFVITTEGEGNVRSDPNLSMQIFKNARLREHIMLEEKPWQVYWFSY